MQLFNELCVDKDNQCFIVISVLSGSIDNMWFISTVAYQLGFVEEGWGFCSGDVAG